MIASAALAGPAHPRTRVLDVHILSCPNWGIVLDATAANDSYDTFVEHCGAMTYAIVGTGGPGLVTGNVLIPGS